MANLKKIEINDTGFLKLPVGTSEQRPSEPQPGMVRYNTTLGFSEGYNGVEWKVLGKRPVWITDSGRLFRSSPGIYTTQSYSTTVVADSLQVVTYSIVSGSLPTGISLNSTTGEISGTPSGVSDFVSNVVSTFTIRAENLFGFSDQEFNIRVDSYYVGRTCMAMNEDQSRTVTAPSGFIFTRVDFTSYGTPNGSCPNYTIGGCHSGARPGQLATSAYPRTSVSVSATNNAFGDPCFGTAKRYRGVFAYSPVNP